MDRESFTVAGRAIGPAEPPYVIAEVGNNHAGDVEAAKVLIAAAADAGADAVKLQIYRAARFLARSSSYYERFHRNELSREDIAELSFQSFKLAFGDEMDEEGHILHSSRFVLVDRRGRVRGYYDGLDEELRPRMDRAIRQLLDEPADTAAAAGTGASADQG